MVKIVIKQMKLLRDKKLGLELKLILRSIVLKDLMVICFFLDIKQRSLQLIIEKDYTYLFLVMLPIFSSAGVPLMKKVGG